MKNNANKWKKKPHNKTRNTHTGKAPTTNWSFSKACSTLTFKSIHFKLRAKIPFHFVGISFFPSWTLNDLMMFAAFHPLDKFTFLSVFSVWLIFFFVCILGKLKRIKDFPLSCFLLRLFAKKCSVVYIIRMFSKKSTISVLNLAVFGFWDTFFIISSVKHFGWNLFYR